MLRKRKGIYAMTPESPQLMEETIDLGTSGQTLIGMALDNTYSSTAEETVLKGTFNMNGADLAIVRWQLDWNHVSDAAPGSMTFRVKINTVTFYTETYNEGASQNTDVWAEGYLMFLMPRLYANAVTPLVFGSSYRVVTPATPTFANPSRAVAANGNLTINPDENQLIELSFQTNDAGTDCVAIMGRLTVEFPSPPELEDIIS